MIHGAAALRCLKFHIQSPSLSPSTSSKLNLMPQELDELPKTVCTVRALCVHRAPVPTIEGHLGEQLKTQL